MMRRFGWLLILGYGCLAAGALAGERTWTDAKGRTMRAEFVREVDGDVTFLKDGMLVTIPLTTLSERDRQIVRDLAAGRPVPDEPAGVAPAPAVATGPSQPAAEGANQAPAGSNKKPLPIVERMWTDKFGNQTKAKFVRIFGNQVVLQRANRNITVPFYDFTSEDQDYLRELLTSRGQEAQIPPPPPPPVDPAEGNPGPGNPFPHNPVPAPGPPPNFPSFPPPQFGGRSSFQEHVQRQHEEMQRRMEESRQRIEQQRQEREQRDAEARQKFQEDQERRRQEEEQARQNQTVGECLSCKGKLTRAQTEGSHCPHCGVAWQFEVDAFGHRRPILNHAPAMASDGATSNGASNNGAVSTPVSIDPATRATAARIIVIGVVIVGVLGMVSVVVFVAITIAAASGAKRQRHYS